MVNGLSLETYWVIKKYWNNKFYYTVSSCWLFLYDLETKMLAILKIMVNVIKQNGH